MGIRANGPGFLEFYLCILVHVHVFLHKKYQWSCIRIAYNLLCQWQCCHVHHLWIVISCCYSSKLYCLYCNYNTIQYNKLYNILQQYNIVQHTSTFLSTNSYFINQNYEKHKQHYFLSSKLHCTMYSTWNIPTFSVLCLFIQLYSKKKWK